MVRTNRGGILRRNRWYFIPASLKQNTSFDEGDDPPIIVEESDKSQTDETDRQQENEDIRNNGDD